MISVCLTTHNRRSTTLSCLAALRTAADRTASSLSVTLVDAGSSDGTQEAVLEVWPDAHVIKERSDVYWASGMRIAMAEATRVSNPDFYFWLNDDTILDPDSLTVMTESLNAITRTPAIVVGATRSSRDSTRTYGGLLAQRRLGAPVFLPCSVSDVPTTCDSLNGNAVLIPRAANEMIGPIPEAFSHALADLDYGLRATRSGIPIVQAPGTIGVCDYGDASRASSGSTGLRDMFGPKRLPPRAWFTYVRRHCGRRWPIHFLGPYLKAAARVRICALHGHDLTASGETPQQGDHRMKMPSA